MSVGDVKGFRRRMKQLAQRGQMPRRSGGSVASSIERNRQVAQRQAAASQKKAK